MDDYRDIRNMLKPRRDIKASDDFRRRVDDLIPSGHQAGFGEYMLWGNVALGMVAVVLILIFIPTGATAKDLLAEAIRAMRGTKNIEMKAEIRTNSHEIFESINPDAELVNHDIMIARSDSADYWYINKGERCAEKNSDGLFVWLNPYNIGWHYSNAERNVLGYLNIFMNPEKILESEYKYTRERGTAVYNVSDHDNDYLLTIRSKPEGNYTNPYALNTSIYESENIRRYIMDGKSYRLKSASVSIIRGSEEIEVLRITDVNYDPSDKKLPSLPANIRFIEEREDTEPAGIRGFDARESASVLLDAFADWDTEILYKFMTPESAEEFYRSVYEGAQLISLGQPFQSGANPKLMFVPYKLRLQNGSVRSMNLVLKNQEDGAWIFDGGL